jgi:ribonuclease Z
MPSAQYIQCANRHFLMDCGEGTQLQLRKYGIKFQRIDHIFISHLHGDHFFGLFGLLSTLHLLGRVKPLTLYAPAALKGILDSILKAGNGSFAYEIVFVQLEGKEGQILFEDEKVKVCCFPLVHKITTFGFTFTQKQKELSLNFEQTRADNVPRAYYARLKQGHDVVDDNGKLYSTEKYTLPADPELVYAYCSDTEYTESIIPYIKNADVLYHEATFIEELSDRAKQTKHSTAREAAMIAQAAKVGFLIMGHLSARYDDGKKHIEEAKIVFPNVSVAEDGMNFNVPFLKSLK